MSSFSQEKSTSKVESIIKDDEDKTEIELRPWKIPERKTKPLVHKSRDRTTNFVEFSLSRLHLSPRKRKPIIRKSKLKFIGNQMFNKRPCITQKPSLQKINATVGVSSLVHGPTCLLEKYKICLCETNLISKNIKSINVRSVFEKGKDVPLQDFRSLSLREKWLPPEDENETLGNFDFVSHCTFRTSKESLKHKLVKKCLRDSELPDLKSLSLSECDRKHSKVKLSCAKQARDNEEFNTDELAAYLDNYLHFPKKMSYMAEMMYT